MKKIKVKCEKCQSEWEQGIKKGKEADFNYYCSTCFAYTGQPEKKE